MFTQTITLALLASAALVTATPTHVEMHKRQKANGDAATATTLAANALQSGSFVDGSVNGVSADGQAKSVTSKNNFINNCAGKTITNGLQILGGSCNGIPMGDIPAKANMVSCVITFPETGGQGPAADTTFDIKVQFINLVAGTFTNAQSNYYSAPQALSGGKVIGHTHVTVQDMGKTMNPTAPLDPTQFAFFKGINDAGDGKGLLSATVTGGLPAGNYRVCTMAAAANHQPVLMPVAQRGTPDDCTKFTVGGGGAAAGGAAAGGAAAGGKGGKGGNAASVSASADVAAASKPAAGGKGGKGGNAASVSASADAAAASKPAAGGKGGKGGNAASVTSSAEVAAASAPAAGGKGGKSGNATSVSSSAEVAAASAPATGGKGGNKNNKGGAEASSPAASAPVASATESSAATAAPSKAASTGNKGAAAGAIAGISAPAVTDSGDKARPFLVNGNTFVNEAAAKQRCCDIQFNACMDAFNSGNKAATQAGCSTQQSTCNGS